MTDRKFDLTTLSPEQRKVNLEKAQESRRRLNPSPVRKKELKGERLRLIAETTNAIKNILIFKGIRYKDLAERLDMTPGHITHLMSGTRNMTLATLADIGEALDMQFTVVASPKDKPKDNNEPRGNA